MLMKLTDVIARRPVPEPWAEGEKIPWNEPEFSQRMLKEHLSQDHDLASRRRSTIDRHVDWIHRHVLGSQPTCVLDLGCGPGLYTSRLARLGHECVGIDFSPASIAYAQDQARAGQLRCTYHQQDVRQADYGDGYGLAMFIYGEFNVFTPADARQILRKACQALEPGGQLLLEASTFAAVRATGERAPSWFSAASGLFSASPHVCLTEKFWDAGRAVATERYYIVDGATAHVKAYAASSQAYTAKQYCSLLEECQFREVRQYPSLLGEVDESQYGFIVIVAKKT